MPLPDFVAVVLDFAFFLTKLCFGSEENRFVPFFVDTRREEAAFEGIEFAENDEFSSFDERSEFSSTLALTVDVFDGKRRLIACMLKCSWTTNMNEYESDKFVRYYLFAQSTTRKSRNRSNIMTRKFSSFKRRLVQYQTIIYIVKLSQIIHLRCVLQVVMGIISNKKCVLSSRKLF